MKENVPQQNRATPQKAGATELINLMGGYRLYARAEGKSSNTISLAIRALEILREYLVTNGVGTDVSRLGVREIREFSVYLQQVEAFSRHPFIRPKARALSKVSVNCYLRSISAFWSWLVREDIVETSPFARVKIPKPAKKVVPTFSVEQIQSLLDSIARSPGVASRDRTMLLVFLDTGIRVTELANMNIDDVYLDEGMIKVIGKGDKERLVPIGLKVQKTMWRYLNQHRPEPAYPDSNRVFLTRDGKPLTKNSIDTLFSRYAARAGIKGMRSSPHVFRHTFSLTFLRNGGDAFSLQRMLGHSSLEVTRTYVNLAQSDVKAAHKRYSPADNMKLNLV